MRPAVAPLRVALFGRVPCRALLDATLPTDKGGQLGETLRGSLFGGEGSAASVAGERDCASAGSTSGSTIRLLAVANSATSGN